MEMPLKLPDCQIKPTSSKQSCMLFHLHSLLFAVVKRRILLFFSDSTSSVEAISRFKLKIDIVQNIIKDYTNLANTGKTKILCWIPSHVNIRDNERADTAAKSALSLPITNIKLSARELIPCSVLTNGKIYGTVAREINLHSIYPTVGIVKHSKNISRYDSILLNRLQIGHSRLTHSYLLSGDDYIVYCFCLCFCVSRRQRNRRILPEDIL